MAVCVDPVCDHLASPIGARTSISRRRGAPCRWNYPEFPIAMLPARDGEPKGNVQRSSSAPNCSYFVNWKSTEDRMVWLLDVQTAGRYKVVIDYTCPEADAGALIDLKCGEHRLTGRVTPGWDPPLYTNQDTLPRPPVESQMKAFRPLELGVLKLDKGTAPLTLRALEIPGNSVMDGEWKRNSTFRRSFTSSS